MVYTTAPNAWLQGWSEDGTDITIANALAPVTGENPREQTLPELNAAEADESTGSFPKILFAILEKIYAGTLLMWQEDGFPGWSLTRTETPVSKTEVNVSYGITFNLKRTPVAGEFSPDIG